MSKKHKKTSFEIEDRQLLRGPRKPKGGGFHKHKNNKRSKKRSDYRNIDPESWEE